MTPRLDAALSDLFQPPSGGSLSCPAPGDWRARKRGQPIRTRIGRSSERKPWRVINALPAGTVRAASQKAWLDAVDQAPALAGLRADALANVRRVAQQLAWRADWTSMTTRPGDDVLVAHTGISERTVHRVVRRLKDAGLLGVVAPNRSPAVQTVKGLAGQGEVAVYVLAVPSPLQLVEPAAEPVDESGLATVAPPSVNEPMRARAMGEGSSEPLRGPHPQPAGAGAGLVVPLRGPALRLPGRTTRRAALESRIAQARRVQHRVPILATITSSYVAAILRDFALAGWSDADVAEAIDWRPDGTRWPHTAATGIDPDPRRGKAAHWLEHRMAPWREQAGAPMPSPSAARLAAARARTAAQLARRHDEELSAREVKWVDFSPGYRAFKAALAALPRGRTQ